jgi:transcriptional regulator with XRE-family HTH domain
MSETIAAAPARQARDGSRGQAFAALIANARRDRGWTQDDLIFRAGVSRSTLARWEAGAAERPDPDAVRSVCVALDIDPKRALIALGYLTADDLAPAA